MLGLEFYVSAAVGEKNYSHLPHEETSAECEARGGPRPELMAKGSEAIQHPAGGSSPLACARTRAAQGHRGVFLSAGSSRGAGPSRRSGSAEAGT